MLFALEVIHSHSVSFFYNAEAMVNFMCQLWHPVIWSNKSRCYCGGIWGWYFGTFKSGFLGGTVAKILPAVQEPQEMWVQSLGWEIIQRRIWQPTPVFLLGESKDRGTSGLQFIGLQRIGHDWSNLAHTNTTFKPACFESSRLPSTMWVGLIQSVKGLRSKESFWKRNPLKTVTEKPCLSFQPADLDSRWQHQLIPESPTSRQISNSPLPTKVWAKTLGWINLSLMLILVLSLTYGSVSLQNPDYQSRCCQCASVQSCFLAQALVVSYLQLSDSHYNCKPKKKKRQATF